ncbi:MAG: hypothetical protein AAFV25_19830 [Bacteroidota bacterium]
MTTYDSLSPQSRVWIYQSKRPFTDEELLEVNQHLDRFATQWVSHSLQLKAFGGVFHKHFIVLMVDESQASASGCSIDSSVRFIKELGHHFGLDLFDRMTFAYREGEQVKLVGRDDFAKLYEQQQINDETLVFDHLVKTKEEFDSQWVKPLKDSWHKRMVPQLPV